MPAPTLVPAVIRVFVVCSNSLPDGTALHFQCASTFSKLLTYAVTCHMAFSYIFVFPGGLGGFFSLPFSLGTFSTVRPLPSISVSAANLELVSVTTVPRALLDQPSLAVCFGLLALAGVFIQSLGFSVTSAVSSGNIPTTVVSTTFVADGPYTPRFHFRSVATVFLPSHDFLRATFQGALLIPLYSFTAIAAVA